jgi:CRP/FNR family transcriptional regulator
MTVSLAIVAQCPALRGISQDAQRALSEVAREIQFRKGERLVPLGQPPQRLLVLTHGLAKLVGVSANGHERILYIHRPGQLVGPTVLLENFRHDYEVCAMSSGKALAVSRRDLLAIGRRHPSVIVALAQEVSRLLQAMTERVMSATSTEVPVRLSQLLLDFAHRNGDQPEELVPLEHPLTHEVMAQIVGASRPHTSTVLRDLEERGAVQRKSRRGLLVRPAHLATIVQSGEVAPLGEGVQAPA